MNAVVSRVEEPGTAVAAITPMEMLSAAMARGTDMAQLQKLMDLQERWEANEARKAYVRAMSAFKAEPIEILKDKEVDFTSQKGRTHYSHASLANVVDAVVARMGSFGLSHRWDVKQEEGAVVVACVITHEQGHSERVEMIAPKDDTGNKNVIQQIGSTITYLQRYTLMSACGLAAKDMDDDGKRAESSAVITESQATDLKAKAEEVGADKEKFLSYFGIESLADLPATRFKEAVNMLNAKGRR